VPVKTKINVIVFKHQSSEWDSTWSIWCAIFQSYRYALKHFQNIVHVVKLQLGLQVTFDLQYWCCSAVLKFCLHYKLVTGGWVKRLCSKRTCRPNLWRMWSTTSSFAHYAADEFPPGGIADSSGRNRKAFRLPHCTLQCAAAAAAAQCGSFQLLSSWRVQRLMLAGVTAGRH